MDEIREYYKESRKLIKILIDFETQITQLKIIQHEIRAEIYEVFEKIKEKQAEEVEKYD